MTPHSIASVRLLGDDVYVSGALRNAATPIAKMGDPPKSLLALRMARTDGLRMPPIGRLTSDKDGVALIQDWIRSALCP